ncbi:molecular chaperone DnaJ [Myxosarcina sp. GI1(2024)]
MNLVDAIATIKSQLEQLALREQANQEEQATINQRVRQLEIEIEQNQLRQSQLDEEAIQLYGCAESLKFKLAKLERIVQLSQEFQNLRSECQQDRDLLDALHASISETPLSENPSQGNNWQTESELNFSREREISDRQITIDTIKQTLPNAEKLYQQLVANYIEICNNYQNFLVDDLDVIWCSLAFIAFGRPSYRQMCLKFHPDRQGCERAMQLINTAWEIARQYLENVETTDSVQTL